MEVILTQTREFLFQLGFLPIVIFVTLIALYFFWVESRRTGKDQNSIFDSYFFGAIFMLIWGRLTYIFTNPVDYEGLIWSYIPYERYPEGLFIFRLLPWRYFRIWDGEFLFTGLFLGFVLGTALFSFIYKRWRWREMMSTIMFSAFTYLGILLTILGFMIEQNNVLYQGVVILSLSLSYFFTAGLVEKVFKVRKNKLWERLNYYLIFLFSILISLYIPSALLKSDINQWDRYNLYIFAAFSVISHIIFIVDVFRKSVKIKTEYRTRSVTISPNQPIKI